MIRNTNALKATLENSICLFAANPDHDVSKIFDDFTRDWRDNSGAASYENGELKLTISHGLADAFAGLKYFALNSDWKFKIRDSESTGELNGFIYHTIYTSGLFQRQSSTTFTQSFLKCFLTNVCFNSESLDILVCLDDLKELGQKDLWGNSFGVVSVTSARALSLANQSKDEWRDFLVKRAELSIRKNVSKQASRYVLSSLGDVGRLNGCSGMTPENFLMVPTPVSENGANIVLWSNGPLQCLTLVAPKKHLLLREKNSIIEKWRELFD